MSDLSVPRLWDDRSTLESWITPLTKALQDDTFSRSSTRPYRSLKRPKHTKSLAATKEHRVKVVAGAVSSSYTAYQRCYPLALRFSAMSGVKTAMTSTPHRIKSAIAVLCYSW